MTVQPTPEDFTAAAHAGAADRAAGLAYVRHVQDWRDRGDALLLTYTHAWLSTHADCDCVIASFERGRSVIARTGQPFEPSRASIIAANAVTGEAPGPTFALAVSIDGGATFREPSRTGLTARAVWDAACAILDGHSQAVRPLNGPGLAVGDGRRVWRWTPDVPGDVAADRALASLRGDVRAYAARRSARPAPDPCPCGTPELPPHAAQDHAAMLALEHAATADPAEDHIDQSPAASPPLAYCDKPDPAIPGCTCALQPNHVGPCGWHPHAITNPSRDPTKPNRGFLPGQSRLADEQAHIIATGTHIGDDPDCGCPVYRGPAPDPCTYLIHLRLSCPTPGQPRPVPCGRHAEDIKAWQGQACGEAGWGPGHRIPPGITGADVDAQVKMIRGWCEAGRSTCGPATGEALHCGSPDHADGR